MGALEGRRAVVIGGSSGFGEQIAERLAAEGARLVLAARNLERLEPVAERLGAEAVACDITRYDEVKGLAASVSDRLGGLDVAINSAGYEDMASFESLSPERVEPMVAVQFTGALYVIQQMAAAMESGGSIITISSLTATLVAEGYAHYAGAKAAINHASRIAASEYGARGIRVNVVSPTLIETPMTTHLLQAPGVADAFMAETPLGRIGRIDDVVGAVIWLAGDESSFVTGQNLHVDGGTSLRRLPRVDDFVRAAARQLESK
jgi:NAD(P)-dependent dehydrogenase (short-subunit alcohol dehydrogenase family)